MARIGIVGSSFSEGHQPYSDQEGKYTLRFQEHLKKYFPQHEFINTAISGRGSDRYLENIINLKSVYNIDILLLENVEDRSQNYLHCNFDIQKEILDDIATNKESRRFYAEKFSLENYKNLWVTPFRELNRKTLLNKVPSRMAKHWVDVHSYMYFHDEMRQVYGVKHVENSVQLCKFLNIIPIHWSQRQAPYFLNDFGISARGYIESNWGPFENYSCDGTHSNDYAVDRLCQEYYKPLIENVL